MGPSNGALKQMGGRTSIIRELPAGNTFYIIAPTMGASSFLRRIHPLSLTMATMAENIMAICFC